MLAVVVVTSEQAPHLPQRRQRDQSPVGIASAVPKSSRHVSHVAVTLEVKQVVMVCVVCVCETQLL